MGRVALTMVVGLIVGLMMLVGEELPSRASDPVDRSVTGIVGVEVPQLRTENSRTYRRPDGSMQARISTTPLNYRDASGAWKPIDNELRTLPNGSLENRASSFKVRLPAKAAGDVRVAHDGHTLGFSLAGAGEVAPDHDGAEATFADAIPHVDVEYEIRGTSLKETLALDSSAAPATYTFALDAPDLQAVAEPSGGVAFRDASGHERFRFGAPWMQDAAGTLSRDAEYVVIEVGGVQSVELRLDKTWLEDPERQYPVRVDPTVGGEPQRGCQLISGSQANVSECSEEPWTWIGRYEEELYRSLVTIPPLEEIIEPETLVTDASLNFWFDEQTEEDPADIDLYGVTRASDGNATWNRATSSTAWSTPGGDLMVAAESAQTLAPEHIEVLTGMGATRLAQGWVDGADSVREMVIKAAHEEVEHADLIGAFEIIIDYRYRTGVDEQYTYDQTELSDGTTLDYNVSSGNVTVSSNDGYPTSGDPRLMLGRYWNTQEPTDRGTFGTRSRGDIGTIALHDGDFGASYRLAGLSGTDEVFVKEPGGSFVATDGKDATLTPHEDGSVTLRFGETRSTWEFARGSPHRLVRVRTSGGYAIDATYDETGRLARLRDSDSLTATFAYDGSGDLRTVTDQSEGVRRYTFDGSHRLTSYTSPAAAVTRYTYDGSGRLTRIDMPDRTAMKLGYAGGSSVVTSLTPVNAENRDLERTTVGGEAAYTTITHPRAHDVTYFHDNHLHVDVFQPGDGPGIAASGDVVKPAPTYDRGEAPYTIDVKTAGIPNGVEEVHLSASRSTVDTLSGRCEAGCPMRLAGHLAFDPRRTEGTYDLQLQAEDGEANRSTSDTWTVHVDRTAPTPSAEGFTVDYRAETRDTYVDWNVARDSSPIINYSHRYRINGGEWSSWTEASRTGFTLGSAAAEDSIDVEVKATDAAGNIGSTASDTVRAAATAPSNTAVPDISGTTILFETLKSTPGAWSGTPPFSIHYQWRRCDAEGGSCADIDGATERRYLLEAGDVDSTLRIVATAENAAGEDTATSSATAVVTIRPPINRVLPRVWGEATTGEALSASDGVWTGGGPITYAYQWRNCDDRGASCSDIEGATAQDYPIVGEDVGATLRVAVTATNDADSVTAVSGPTAVVEVANLLNTAAPTISEETGTAGDTLLADPGTWAGSGPIAYAYRWQRCDDEGQGCVNIAGATGSSYVLDVPDVGTTLRVLVIASNGDGSETATSDATDEIANAAPSNVTGPSISGSAIVGGFLTADDGTWSGARPMDFTYQWQSCDERGASCADIEAATDPLYTPVRGDEGTTVRVVVTATSSAGEDTATSAVTPVLLAESVLVNSTPPAITGTLLSGETLSADEGLWSGTGTIDYAYQWLHCNAHRLDCAEINGATEGSYELAGADVGKTLAVRVTATDDNESADVTTISRQVRAAGAPVEEVAPAISGAAVIGEELSVSEGTWTGTGPRTYAYQWQVCDEDGSGCEDIDGAIEATVTLTGDELQGSVRALVIARNGSGSTATLSDGTATVTPPTPYNTDAPTIEGVVRAGQELTADQGDWTGDGSISYAYQWRNCDARGEECADIEGATAARYTLANEDVDGTVRVLVSARDESSTGIATSEPTSNVVASAAPLNTVPPAISGTAEAGETLSAGEGTWTGTGPISYTYEWQSCDPDGGECDDLEGATASTYGLTSDDVGATVRVLVTATNAAGADTAASATTATIGGTPPDPFVLANTSPPSISGTARDGEQLTAHPGDWTEHDAVTYAYQWRRCDQTGRHCVDIGGATATRYTLVHADEGNTIRVVITASSTSGSHAMTSDPTDPVLVTDPTSTTPPALSGSAVDGQTLSADDGAWTGRPEAFGYLWERCDSEGASCSTILEAAADPAYTLVEADVGNTVRVTVTATNEAGSAGAASGVSAVVRARAPVAGTMPAITGTAIGGAVLSASTGTWAGTRASSYAYQWQRCNETGRSCSNLEGATAATYSAEAADVRSTLRVVVTARNAAGSASSTSAATAVVSPENPPVNVIPPTIYGFANPGQSLSATFFWSGLGPIGYAYQWQRCDREGAECSDIEGATQATYAVLTEDTGSTLRLTVEARNASGSDSVQSEATAVVTGAGPVNEDLPRIPAPFWQGAVATAEPGFWTGTKPMTHTYQWQRCNARGESCADIEGATAARRTFVEADVGGTLRVAVTARNELGSASAVLSAATSVITAGPIVSTSPPTITGTPKLVTGYATIREGRWSGSVHSVGYQWQRCDASGRECVDIPDATRTSYLPIADDLGKRLVVVATAHVGETFSVSAASSASAIVTPLASGAPSNVVAPTVGGRLENGHRLTADPGIWNGTQPITFEYQWQRCSSPTSCTNISGATAQSYQLATSDIARGIRVLVTGGNSSGWSAPAPSSTTAAITDPAPSNLTAPSITGDTVVGSTLTVSTGEWAGSVDWWSYQWQRCDERGDSCTDITGAYNSTYRPAHPDEGSTLRVVVEAKNAHGEATETSAPSDLVIAADRPTITRLPSFTFGSVEVGELLMVERGSWSGSPTITYEYQWRRCNEAGADCIDIPGGSSIFEFSSSRDVIRADVGATLAVTVTATNGAGSVSVTTDPSEVVPDPGALSNVLLPTLPYWLTPTFGEYFASEQGDWTGEPDISDQWQRCDPLTLDPETEEMTCIDIPGATNAREYHPVAADVGFKLRLKETARSTAESETVYSDPTTLQVRDIVQDDDGTYTGIPVVGQTITAESTVTSRAGLPITTLYTFLREDEGEETTVLQEGEEASYRLTEAELDHRVRIEMTATIRRADREAIIATREVATRTAIVEGPPSDDAPPAITGTTVAGATLRASEGEWSGGGGTLTYAYQWRRCDSEGAECADITDATDPTYVLGLDDVGTTLRVRVTARNGGASGTANSDPSAMVDAADPPVNTDPPTISGTAIELETLTADPGTWGGDGPIRYVYQWLRCDPDGTACSAVDGATARTYRPPTFTEGLTIRVRVTATNGGGEVQATSAATEPLNVAPTPVNLSLPSLTSIGPNDVGSTLMTDRGTWSNIETSELFILWERCDSAGEHCVEIPEADPTQSYTLTATDVGARVRARVLAKNLSGQTAAISELTPTVVESAEDATGKLVYVREDRSEIVLADQDGSDASIVVACAEIPQLECEFQDPRISPNGKAIVATSGASEAGVHDLVVANYDGSDPRLLAVDADASQPVWTPEGDAIVFTATDEGGTALKSIAADGSDADSPTSLTVEGANPAAADFALDGSSMLYTAEASGGDRSLFVRTGTSGRAHTLDLGEEIQEVLKPRLSADGAHVVFAAPSHLPYQTTEEEVHWLYTVNVDGSHLRQVSQGSDTHNSPVFSPDGQVIFSSHRGTIVTSYGEGISIDFTNPTLWASTINGSGGHALVVGGGLDLSIGPPKARAADVITDVCGSLPICSKAKDEWDDLKPAEQKWCKEHPRALCYAFLADGRLAEYYAEKLFTGINTDSSMSNAFQHTYWTALMTSSALIHQVARIGIDNLTEDEREWGYQYARAHEQNERTGRALWKQAGPEGRKSRMDIHNNRVGSRLARLFPERRIPRVHNQIYFCTAARYRVANLGMQITKAQAEQRPPPVAVELPYWYVLRDGDKPSKRIAHIENNSCRG